MEITQLVTALLDQMHVTWNLKAEMGIKTISKFIKSLIDIQDLNSVGWIFIPL